jgi:TFIIF-interacting CTD phosphatase-like protein
MSKVLFSFNNTERLPHRSGPKTLILDLDETLLHSWENPSFLETYQVYSDPQIYRKFHPVGSPPIAYSMFMTIDGKPNRIWGLLRPYLYEFLSFAGEYFDYILVWSAGLPQYVEEIVRQIFLESGLKPPKIVWGRNKCSNYKGLYHKPISEINAELSNRHYQTFQIDPKSTLVLDDKIHTFMENPANGVLIKPYHPGKDRPHKIPTMTDLLDRSDDALLKFQQWLETPEVRNCEDVTLLDKTQIFK